jgi:protein-tyrosine phosphatase
VAFLDRLIGLLGLDFDFDLRSARFDAVAPGLFVGARPRPQDVPDLHQAGIVAVVSCLPTSEREALPFLGDFEHRFLPLDDRVGQDLGAAIPAFFEAVQGATGALLVHCEVGVSRSASLAIARVMDTDGLRFFEAYQQVRTRRPQVLPNVGFAAQLQRFEDARHPPRDGLPSLTRYLKEVCMVPAAPSVIDDALRAHDLDPIAAIESIFGDVPRVVQGVRRR